MSNIFLPNLNSSGNVIKGYQCFLEKAKHNSIEAPQIDDQAVLFAGNNTDDPVVTTTLVNLWTPILIKNTTPWVARTWNQTSPDGTYGVSVDFAPSGGGDNIVNISPPQFMTTPYTLEVDIDVTFKIINATNPGPLTLVFGLVPLVPPFNELSFTQTTLGFLTPPNDNTYFSKTGKLFLKNWQQSTGNITVAVYGLTANNTWQLVVNNLTVKARCCMPNAS